MDFVLAFVVKSGFLGAGLATRLPQPKDLLTCAKSSMYTPTYRKYR